MPVSWSERRVDWTSSSNLDERLNRWSECASEQSQLLRDESLTRRSSLRIGGSAKYWIEVGAIDDLSSLLACLSDSDFVCVGLGSNSLFPDDGIDVPVIRLVGELAEWNVRSDCDGDAAKVEVMAGVINAHLVRGLLADGWVGAEFLTLIPGTFGGAVALNAGTREKELKAVLESVWVAARDDEQCCWHLEHRSVRDLEMSYRHTRIGDTTVVVAGRLAVEQGDVEAAQKRVMADKERRNRTQPYRLASVGSTFANPDGDYAGRLIEEAGLKGEAIGGAKISSLHANFFINDDDASAEDFLKLMALARHRVRHKFDIELRPEVKFVGFDGRARMLELERELEDRDV